MKFHLTPFLAAVGLAASAVTLNNVEASIARTSLSIGHKPAFGLSTNSRIFNKIPRGGAQEQEEEGEEVQEVLYLPGLLDANIKKSKQVCCKCAKGWYDMSI